MFDHVSVSELAFDGVRVETETTVSFDEVINRLHRLCGNSSIPKLVSLAKNNLSEAQYIEEVEKRFVGESGFMLFHEIDHGGWMTSFGIQKKMVRWILGNPLIAITMLRHDLTSGLFAPVEILVTEQDGGIGSVVTYVKPSSLIVMNENPELRSAAEALDEKFATLVSRITGC
jgi:uncharacterized protein (DUF302 family)